MDEPLPGRSHSSPGPGRWRGGAARSVGRHPRRPEAQGADGCLMESLPLPASQSQFRHLPSHKRGNGEGSLREEKAVPGPCLAWLPNALPPRGLLEVSGGPGETPWAGGQGPLLRHFHQLEDATQSCESCLLARWHTQAREHLALPGPSLAEDLKTVCGNPSRPPGPRASRLRVLRGENTETETAALGRAAEAHSQPAPCPQHTSFLLLQGRGWKPLSPARMPRNREAPHTRF